MLGSTVRVDSSVRNNRPTQVETTTTQVETTHHPVRNPPPTELETRSPQSETWATSRNLTRPKCKRKGPYVIKGSSALKTSSWVSIFKWRRQGTGQPGRTLRKNGGDSGQTDIGFTSSWLRVGRRQWSNRRWFHFELASSRFRCYAAFLRFLFDFALEFTQTPLRCHFDLASNSTSDFISTSFRSR